MRISTFTIFSTFLVGTVLMAQEVRSAIPVAEPSGEPVVGDGHRLDINDLVAIRVFQEADLSTQARVSASGTVRMPLIGNVHVKGLTAAQASEKIETALADGYLVSPQVSVNVLSISKKFFTVLGQVNNPGAIEITPGREITLLEAIGRAGGFTRIANSRRVKVKRTVGSRTQVIEFNAKELARNEQANPVVLREGDIITVSESAF